MFFCVFFFQLELESMQKVNIAFHKWETKSTLEYSLQKFRWSICFSTHSLASLDGLQCPKIQSSSKLWSHCSDKISMTFIGQMRCLYISLLGEVLLTKKQTKQIHIYFLMTCSALWQTFPKQNSAILLERLLLYFKFSGHRQWIRWHVNLCQFLPLFFWICPFTPSPPCSQQLCTC